MRTEGGFGNGCSERQREAEVIAVQRQRETGVMAALRNESGNWIYRGISFLHVEGQLGQTSTWFMAMSSQFNPFQCRDVIWPVVLDVMGLCGDASIVPVLCWSKARTMMI